jgi:hypothetical protein
VGQRIRRRLPAVVIVAVVISVLAPAALASVVQITNTGSVSPPSCPGNPCAVISRTTAMQVVDSGVPGPFVIKRFGRITRWSITLALPSATQIHFFDTHEGGTARAALAVLRRVRGLSYELIAESPVVHLEPYFGRTATLKLANWIPVVKGDIVALTVPTWVPALALNYPSNTSWRASRATTRCMDVARQTMQSVIGSDAGYDCLYQTALVTYAASERTSH